MRGAQENQGKLFDASRGALPAPASAASPSIEPSTHDRHESRRATVIRDTSVAAANRFPGVVALARITSRRRLHGKRADKPAVRYCLLSKYIPAKRLLQIVRSHWGIENSCTGYSTWCSTRIVAGPERQWSGEPGYPAKVRNQHHSPHPSPISMRQKVKRAGWDDAFLLDLISHMR